MKKSMSLFIASAIAAVGMDTYHHRSHYVTRMKVKRLKQSMDKAKKKKLKIAKASKKRNRGTK